MPPPVAEFLEPSPPGSARYLPEVYAALALLLVLTYCLLTPPFFGADEIAHAERALEIAHGEWVPKLSRVGEPVTEIPDTLVVAGTPLPIRTSTADAPGFGAPMDTSFLLSGMRLTSVQRGFVAKYPMFTHRPDERFPPALFAAESKTGWSRQAVFTNFRNTGTYPPVFYLPAALAWGLSERTGTSILHALLAARLCTGVCAVLIGWIALRLGGPLRFLLFFLLLLPALTSIEASCSQDALLIPSAALICSLIARAVSAGRLPRWSEWIALSLLMGVCVAARPPYLPLVFLLLLPCVESREPGVRRWMPAITSVAVACLLAGTWHVAIRPAGLVHSGVSQPAAQITFMQGHPVHTAVLLMEWTARKAPEMIVRGVEVLEMKNPRVMAVVFGAHILGLLWALVYVPRLTLRHWTSRVLLVAVLCCVVAGISLAEYVIWTPPGANALDGLQARYYLPLLPFALAFALLQRPASSALIPALLRKYAAVGVSVYLAGVLYMPFLLAHRYYGTGLGTDMMLWFR